MTKVFITGASGFIAQHIVKLLVSKGYEVIGTVRSLAKGAQLSQQAEKTQINNNKSDPNVTSGSFTYVVVPDIAAPNAFDKALEQHSDITYLIHTASPFTYDTTDPENDLVLPAINGTRNILESATNNCRSLKKIVLTSSDAAIYSNIDERNNQLSFNEKSWNDVKYEDAIKDAVGGYYGAKSFAEKLAWDFVDEQKPSWDLVAVNPSYVFGPQAYTCDPRHLNTSNALIGDLLEKKEGRGSSEFENEIGGYIDVRDVAQAHVYAMEDVDKKCIGKRLFLNNGQFSVQMMLDVINDKFPELGLIKGLPGSGVNDIKVLAKVDNSATKTILPWQFMKLDEIVVDTVQQILDYQNVKNVL